jgi:hypothetical protein
MNRYLRPENCLPKNTRITNNSLMMKEGSRKTLKINEVIGQMKETNQLPRINDNHKTEIKEQESEKFLAKYNSLPISARYELVRIQSKDCTKTIDTVNLPGRIRIIDDPETFLYMVESFFRYAGIEAKSSALFADDLLSNAPEMSMQDMELFFKKFRLGMYGELYGKLSPMLISQKLNNFCNSVGYNLDLARNKYHLSIKEIEGHRDLKEYNDNNRPDNLE